MIHLNDAAPEKVQAVPQNTTDLLTARGPDAQVELVAHGPGIAVATGPTTGRLTDLLSAGLTVCVC